MKRLLLLACLILPFVTMAQTNEGIHFEHGTFEEALAKAKKENKMIFMDCYTSWCGPCKQVAKNIFPQKKVGDFYNENFINVKFDMEKGEGVDLHDRYNVDVYPTFIYIDKHGDVVHRFVGGMSAEGFLWHGDAASKNNGLANAQKKYKEGNREPAFVKDYIDFLTIANMKAEGGKVVEEFLSNVDKAKLKEKDYWEMFKTHVNDPKSPLFQYVLKNKEEFYKTIDQYQVEMKISGVWYEAGYAYVDIKATPPTFDKKGFDEYIKYMEAHNVKDIESIVFNVTMDANRRLNKWDDYLKMAVDRYNKGKANGTAVWNWGLRTEQMCKDKKIRLKMADLCEKVAEETKKQEKKEKESGITRIGFSNALSEIAEKLRK